MSDNYYISEYSFYILENEDDNFYQGIDNLNYFINQSLDMFEYKARQNRQIDILDQKILDATLHESLNNYKTQERKPDIELKLNEILFGKEKIDIDDCRICLEKFIKNDKITKTQCCHWFHYDCLSEWGKYKQECPLCKSELPCK